MNKLLSVVCLVLLAFTLVGTSCTSNEESASPADFYKGKTITIVTTSEIGSSVDLLGRVLAKYLAEDTGATVVVESRRGAGGMEGMNYLYKAKPDGLTLGVTGSIKMVTNRILNDPSAEYEFEKFSCILTIDSNLHYLFVSAKGSYQSVAALQAATNLKLAGASASGQITLAGLSIVKLLQLDAKVITGFSDNAARSLATQRGEVAGYANVMSGMMGDLATGTLKPLFVLATQRDPQYPEVPAITELVTLNGDDLKLVKLWETALLSNTLFAAPPGTPEDILAYLRDLANKWTQEEGFRQEVDAIAGLPVKIYQNGEVVQRMLLEMAASASEFQTLFADLIAKYRA